MVVVRGRACGLWLWLCLCLWLWLISIRASAESRGSFELRNQYSKLPALRFSFPSSGTTFERGGVRQSIPGGSTGLMYSRRPIMGMRLSMGYQRRKQ